MIQKQNFVLSLAGGIDTKTDEKQVLSGKLLTLQNGIFISPKEIQKRNGYIPLPTNVKNTFISTVFNSILPNIDNSSFLNNFNKELVLNDRFNLYSYSEGLGEWVYKGRNSICQLETNSIVRTINSQTLPDSAISVNGIQIFAWEDSSTGNSKVSIIDTNTNQVIVNGRDILPIGGGTTIKPKCVSIGNYLIVFYVDTTTNMHLYYLSYSASNFNTPVLVTPNLKTGSTTNNYDVNVFNNNLYLTYNSSVGGNSIVVTYFNGNLVQGTNVSQVGINADNAIGIFGDINFNVWVGYANSTTASTFIVNQIVNTIILGPTIIQSLTNIYNITGIGDNGFATFFYDVLGSTDINGKLSNARVRYAIVTTTGTSSGGAPFLNSVALETKAFSLNFNGVNIPHIIVTHDAALQPTYFLCNLYNISSNTQSLPFNIVSKIAPSLGGGIPSRSSSLSQVNQLSLNIFQTALLQKDLLYTSVTTSGTVNTFTQTGVISATNDFTITNPNNIVLGDNLHIGSGMVSMYDGTNIVEHNFHLYPEAIALTINSTGGLLGMGSYGYQVTYEWTDNQGQLHRSNPSPIISAASGNATGQGVLIIPTLRITAKTNINIVIYRTQINGTVYYRLNLPNNPLYNDLTIDTVTYTDNASDASIAANEQLYTTGGEVGNISAPASTAMSTYQNRVILTPSEDPSSWWYSKQVIPGSPVEFSNVFVENISTIDAGIVISIQMDSNNIFLKQNSIWYVTGQGPAPSGANNDFTDALSIASDVGCTDPQSIVLNPMGIIFKSTKGIYLLSRGLALSYIGADVEAFNQFKVTSAQLISYTNQIRFTLDNGNTLVYDYLMQQWSVFTNINVMASVIDESKFTYVQPNGVVLQETPGIYTDNGNFIKLSLTTSWLSLAGIQGFQRIYKALILGKYFGPHKLQVQFAYDFNPIVTQQDNINITDLINPSTYGQDYTYGLNSPYGGNYPLYQWRVFTNQQVCQAIQITLSDNSVAGPFINGQGQQIQVNYNEALSLSAISLEVGIKHGLFKASSSRSSS